MLRDRRQVLLENAILKTTGYRNSTSLLEIAGAEGTQMMSEFQIQQVQKYLQARNTFFCSVRLMCC